MRAALLLIDLQHDFLRARHLEPAAGSVVERAAALLQGCRALSVPVLHVWTTVRPENDQRMPHWKRAGRWECVEGTEGHAPPPALRPAQGEPIIHKTGFSPFCGEALERCLAELGVDALVLAGVHLHACVRATALDAYQRGYEVRIAEDAVASDDPLHAAITHRYLSAREVRFSPVSQLLSWLGRQEREAAAVTDALYALPAAFIDGETIPAGDLRAGIHRSPRHQRPLWSVTLSREELVARACAAARSAGPRWSSTEMAERAQLLERLAPLLEAESAALAEQMAIEIGKPVTQGQAEVSRGAALLKATAGRARDPLEQPGGAGACFRYRPLGVIGMVTPWNNPVAIPLGKIAPALLYGNTVAWKPAPAASSVALWVMELLHRAGCPPGVVNLVCGDRSTALALMGGDVDAVTLSGSLASGRAAQEICGRRMIPLQAELGGNNAAIVWSDSDLEEAAARIAEGAFGFAGQRCTANRRVIVDARCCDEFLSSLQSAVANLVWGDPLDLRTQIGPLVTTEARDRVAALVSRTGSAHAVLAPHRDRPECEQLLREGAYYPPTIICCDDPEHEVVQEETFGPVLVLQRAADWEEAMKLCNGVRQGLVAALFSSSAELQARFLQEAQAGILKLNSATADADAETPFGGWKASGIGPPEHGAANREFYTRTQAVYGWRR